MRKSLHGLATVGGTIAALTLGALVANADSPGRHSVLGPDIPAVAMSEAEMAAVEGSFWSFFIQLNSSTFSDSGNTDFNQTFTDGDAESTVDIHESGNSSSVSTTTTCSSSCSSSTFVFRQN